MLQENAELLANLTRQAKELEAQITAIKEVMVGEMKADNLTQFKSDHGTVSFVTRKKYAYTDAVTKLEQQMKLKKIEEEETGVAQVSVTEYVQISLPK